MIEFIRTKEYLEKLFSNQKDPWYVSWRASQRYRYNAYVRLLTPYIKSNDRLLDIGCALGDFTVLLAQMGKLKRVVGIDVAESAIERAKRKFLHVPSLEFIAEALPQLSFSNGSFNVVTILETFYYLPVEQRERSLQEIYRVLVPGGILFISVNLGERYFQEAEIKELLQKTNFHIEDTYFSYGKLYHALEKWPLIFYEKAKEYEVKGGLRGAAMRVFRGILERFLGIVFFASISNRVSRLFQDPDQVYTIARKNA